LALIGWGKIADLSILPIIRGKEHVLGCNCYTKMISDNVTLVAGAGGFWGDQVMAPVHLLNSAKVDYLTMDYLAEVTMSIMHKQKSRDKTSGWATDLLDWLQEGGMEILKEQGTKLVTNAGGANPKACAEAVLGLACALGWVDCQIAMVIGDDIHQQIIELNTTGQLHTLDGGCIEEDKVSLLTSANAYVGAGPIARALQQGADIVLCGRVADASLIVGSMLHSSGWAANAAAKQLPLCSSIDTWAPIEVTHPLDIIAGWTLAGHLIECGAQVSGGNADSWPDINDLVNIGYPIAEIHDDGTSVITKPSGSGGAVTRANVAEQLLYEIGDPASYLTPDVILDITAVSLDEIGPDRIEVQGARGRRRPEKLKVSACYPDGWFASSTLLVPGPQAIAKSKATDYILRQRLKGLESLNIHTEMIGTGITMPSGGMELYDEIPELMIRWSATSPNRKDVETFAKSISPLVLTGPAGVCGYSARPRPRAQLRFVPLLVDRSMVEARIEIPMLRTLRKALTDRRPNLETSIFNRLQKLAENENRRITKRIAGRVLRELEKPVRGGKIY